MMVAASRPSAPSVRSRLSIAADLERDLATIGVRQLLVRELAPRDWHARGFVADGSRVTHHRAGGPGFATALVELLAVFDSNASTSDAIAELASELSALRVEQIFLRQLGPNDFWQASAFAADPNRKIVEAKAAAPTFREALSQLLANLDQATDTEDQ